MLTADSILRKRLSRRMVMALAYLGGAVGFLLVYATRALPIAEVTQGTAVTSMSAMLMWLLVPTLWTAHFLRRTIEVLVVHHYNRMMSPAEFIGTSAYYFGFGIWIAGDLADAGLAPPANGQLLIGIALFVVGEAGNAWHHLVLKRLRDGNRRGEFAIPDGGLFRLVSCPHYLFELVGWTGFLALQPNVATGAFLLVSFVVLLNRALIRHRAYRTIFDGRQGRQAYPSQRKALIPFVI